MARPRKAGLDYFPHDVHASNDVKVEPLLFLYGANGYAFYFLHLEYIYREADLELDVSDAETTQILSQKLKISDEEYRRILKSCLKYGLFDETMYTEHKKLTSNGIKKRAQPVFDKRETSRQISETKKELVSATETPQIGGVSVHKEKESKKERKAKKRRVLTVVSLPPLFRKFLITAQRNNLVDAHKFVDFYASKGWLVGKTKMKDWKASVRTWEKADGRKVIPQCQECDYQVRGNYCAGKTEIERAKCAHFTAVVA